MPGKSLSSISESGNTNPVSRTFTGFSSYARYPSTSSLNTLSNVSSFKNKNDYPQANNAAEHALLNRLQSKSLVQKNNYEFCKKIRVSIALFGILFLVAAIFMLSFYLPKQYEKNTLNGKTLVPSKNFLWDNHIKINHLQVSFSSNFSKLMSYSDFGPKIALKGYFGELLTAVAKENFTKVINESFIKMTFQDSEPITLTITKQAFSNQCYEIHWRAKYHTKLQDCFDTKSSHWFGLGELFTQKWPLSRLSFPMTPFLTSDFVDRHQPDVFGGVLEPLLVNNLGGGIYVADYVPLHVSMNENNLPRFCIRADRNKYHIPYSDQHSTNELNYTICIADDIKKVHKILFEKFIDKPNGIPDKQMLIEPIWSTWVRYKKDINQKSLINFVDEIKFHNFEGSQIEIDDQYSDAYGDYNFDPNKFPDIVNTINIIRSAGFRITVWAYPFSNIGSKSFNEYRDFVTVGEKSVPGMTEWWDGVGGVIDTTNPLANQNFIKRLLEFKKLRIDGFKFDAGEVNYLPPMYRFKTPQVNPNYFSYHYVELASNFSGLSEVRVGYRSQKFPVFVRILDRLSEWEVQNGLRSVLTAALTFSILGYPFILPDMVGGNAYVNKPNRELYVRWAQLSAFLPAIQFSITPWDYDKDVVSLVKSALKVRKSLSEEIYKAALEAQITGDPIIRPLWWYWPQDQEAITIDSEFMLGESYLVAPVLHQNIVSHVIYLPIGVWEEQWGQRRTLNITKGRFSHFNVTISDICYFKLVK